MADLIDRRVAIDALADMHCKSDEDGYVWIIRSDAWGRIDALPPAQPEIIRCKECKRWNTVHDRTKAEYGLCQIRTQLETTKKDDWCSRAERRDDAADKC